MDARHQHKSMGYLIGVLGGSILYGIGLPVGVVLYLIIPMFFKDGTFSADIFYTWTTFQIIAAIVLTLAFIAFEIFAVTTTINII